MDQRERLGSLQEGLKSAIEGYLSRLWTALPGFVQSVNFEKMTVVVNLAIQGLLTDQKSGAQRFVKLPPILDIPVVFPCAGNFAFTLPIAAGDEVLVIFSSRCFDQWFQSGQTSRPGELRVNDLSDAFAIPGPRSIPNVLGAISSSTAQLRTKDGSAYIELTATGAVNIKAPGGVTIQGDLMIDGATVGTGEGTFNGIATSTHLHSGVTGGGSDTGPPV